MSKHIRKGVRASLLYLAILFQCAVLALPMPMRVFAQESTAETAAEQPAPSPAQPTNTEPPAEVRRPTGSSAHTYTYNFETGLWENEYYTWNPSTSLRSARFAPEHTYNEQAGIWEVREWVYVASEGAYRYRITSTYAPAPPPVQEPDPVQSSPETGNSIGENEVSTSPVTTTPNSLISVLATPTNNIVISPQGTPYQTDINLVVDATLTMTMNNTATSGNASVLQNTNAGNATSGDAYAMANIINMVQSAWSSQGLQPNIFSADIQGNYYGDIVMSPTQLSAGSNPCNCGDLTVNATINGAIENNVNLLATSGNANVQNNTQAGDATSGNATAVANIMNMIHSSIASGNSFVGVLNVHGDLDGDVLMPDQVLDELIAANVPKTQLSIGNDQLIDLDSNQSITNNISTTANSGDATVARNTNAGSATSGSAQTNVTVFNLTGRQIIGSNALLVFVNVSGEWIGFITDAPAGSTAAMLGNDTSNQLACAVCGGDYTASIKENAYITNDVTVNATSGNANVSENTNAGNATSGNAAAAANIGNITNSSFSLTDWFGILFINIFGDWHGSFGTDTNYGGLSSAGPLGSTAATGTVDTPIIGRSVTKENQTTIPPNVRMFNASFASDDEGNEVLVAASEQTTPPSSTDVLSAQTASIMSENSTRDFSSLLLVLAAAAAFVVIMHGDSIKALALRTRQF